MRFILIRRSSFWHSTLRIVKYSASICLDGQLRVWRIISLSKPESQKSSIALTPNFEIGIIVVKHS